MIEQMTLKQLLYEPQKVEELNIPQGILTDLIYRLLFNEGNVSVTRIIEVLKVSMRIIDETMLWMQKEHLVEVSKASTEIGRMGYVYTLTDEGKNRARDSFERSQYVGPVPVPIHYYARGIELQTQVRRKVADTEVIDFDQAPGPARQFPPAGRSGHQFRQFAIPVWAAWQREDHHRPVHSRADCRHGAHLGALCPHCRRQHHPDPRPPDP